MVNAPPRVATRTGESSSFLDMPDTTAAQAPVPHVALRVWGKSVPVDFDESGAVNEAQRTQAAAMGAPQCGPAAGNPFVPWFGEVQEHVRSVALVPLGQTAVIGLLALGSEDAQRFYAEMGTLYLRRIGELTAAALAARL